MTVWFASYIYYIEGAAAKILIDTGFTDPAICREKMNHECRRSAEMTVANRLGALGVKPDEIEVVVLTHCHWDHIGGIGQFPNAQVYCQQAEVSWKD